MAGEPRETWSSNYGFIVAAVGSVAVGLFAHVLDEFFGHGQAQSAPIGPFGREEREEDTRQHFGRDNIIFLSNWNHK